MAVYVDYCKNKYQRMLMCHMLADSIEELHDMAEKIGVKKKWFQIDNMFLHYDICQSKRKLAIKNGAIEMNTKDILKKLKSKYEL